MLSFHQFVGLEAIESIPDVTLLQLVDNFFQNIHIIRLVISY